MRQENQTILKVILGILIICVACSLLYKKVIYNNTDLTWKVIHSAEYLAKNQHYDLSTFCYQLAKKINPRTYRMDLNIAKNINSKYWNKPLTPKAKAELKIALKYLDKEFEKEPDNINILSQYAFTYELLTESEKAIEYFEKTVEKNPKWYPGYVELAQLYSHVKCDYKKALEYIEKAIELNPSDTAYLFEKAWLLEYLDRHKEAITYYSKYLEKYPNSVAALTNISNAEIRIKDWANAEMHTDMGLKLNPHSAYLISNKVDILMAQHKFNEAKQRIAFMLNSNDSSGYIGYFQLAQIYKYEKDTENAEKYYTLAKENAQKYFNMYCEEKTYYMYDHDAFCYNRYIHLKNFEKSKTEPLDF